APAAGRRPTIARSEAVGVWEATMSRVVKVEPIPVSYPEPNDFNAIRHLCLVKITTDDGVVGWGESITQFPEASLATKAIVDVMAERVVGKDQIGRASCREGV